MSRFRAHEVSNQATRRAGSRQLHDVGKVIQVRNEELFVYDSKLKKKKLHTPVKGKEDRRALSFAASHIKDPQEHLKYYKYC